MCSNKDMIIVRHHGGLGHAVGNLCTEYGMLRTESICVLTLVFLNVLRTVSALLRLFMSFLKNESFTLNNVISSFFRVAKGQWLMSTLNWNLCLCFLEILSMPHPPTPTLRRVPSIALPFN